MLPFAAVALLAATAAAQRLIVVDRLNRAGAHFTDLPPAVAAAQNGDVIELRAGAGPYSPFTTNKALTILGNLSGIVVGPGQRLRISGVPAGRDFVMYRCCFLVNQQRTAPLVEVGQCAGGVHFVECQATNLTGAPAIDVLDCAAVTFRETTARGSPALLVRNSTLSFAGGSLCGTPAEKALALSAGEGLRASNSRVTLAGCIVAGGFDAASAAPAPAPAITMTGSLVYVGGGNLGGRLDAGTAIGVATAPSAPGVQGQGLVLIDPGVTVRTTAAPPFTGVNAARLPVPSLRGGGGPIVHLMFDGPAAPVATLVGRPATPLSLPWLFGTLWLAPAPLIAWPGALPEVAIHTLPRGSTVVVQTVSLTSAGLALSNPVVATSP